MPNDRAVHAPEHRAGVPHHSMRGLPDSDASVAGAESIGGTGARTGGAE